MIKSAELSRYFEINERTIRKWLTRKYLTGSKKKGIWYVGKDDLLYFMEKHPERMNDILKIFSDYNIKLGKAYNVNKRC